MASGLTRREFLERSSLTAAAATVAAGFATRDLEAAARAGMFISLNGATSRGASGVDRARLAAKIGFGGVDWDFAPFKALGVDGAKSLLAELKVRPTITGIPGGTPWSGDDAAFQARLPQLSEDAAFCAAIGCTRMMAVLPATTPGAVPKDDFRKLMVARLSAVSEVLVKSNVRLGLEFLGPLYFHTVMPPAPAAPPPGAPAPAATPPGQAQAAGQAQGGGQGQGGGARRGGGAPAGPRVPFIYNMPDTLQLAKDSGPAIGIVCDVWHWYHSGGTAQDILNAGNARIVEVHLSDAKAMAPEDVRDSMRVMPGEGIIDYNVFFGALQKAGYDGGVSPEPLGRIPNDMTADDAAKLAYDTALAVMKKAGVA